MRDYPPGEARLTCRLLRIGRIPGRQHHYHGDSRRDLRGGDGLAATLMQQTAHLGFSDP